MSADKYERALCGGLAKMVYEDKAAGPRLAVIAHRLRIK